MFLVWLSTFGSIWAGGIILGSIVGGIHKTIEKTTGKDFLILESIGVYLIFEFCYGITGGFIWLLLAKIKLVAEGRVIWGVLVGEIVGSFIFLLSMQFSHREEPRNVRMLECGWSGMLVGIIVGLVVGSIVTKFRIFIGGITVLSCLVAGILTGISLNFIRFSTIFIMPPVILLLGHCKIMCNTCLRYSNPLQAKYDLGIRRCEHCNQIMENTKECGKVIFTFGNYHIKQGGRKFILFNSNLTKGTRKFVLENPDFEKKEAPIDVSEIYIDTKTADKHLVERFITHIRNYPPRYGLDSVRIFYRGQLDDLGYLKNSILNNFRKARELKLKRS
jgi:hypothetical protein